MAFIWRLSLSPAAHGFLNYKGYDSFYLIRDMETLFSFFSLSSLHLVSEETCSRLLRRAGRGWGPVETDVSDSKCRSFQFDIRFFNPHTISFGLFFSSWTELITLRREHDVAKNQKGKENCNLRFSRPTCHVRETSTPLFPSRASSPRLVVVKETSFEHIKQ